MNASSQDLHPTSGARFVIERQDEAGTHDAPRYRVDVYLPEGRRAGGSLSWPSDDSILELADPTPAAQDAWVVEGALKLARVLKRDPKARLIRWREAP